VDFRRDPGQRMLQRTVSRLVDQEIAPRAAEYDRTGEFPSNNVSSIAKLGLFGVGIPKEYGGHPGGIVENCIVTEELARGCRSTASIRRITWMCAWTIAEMGTPEQKERYVPSLARGETMGAGAWTEPEAGSDRANISTTARLDGNFWVLNGSKHYISNWGVAGVYKVFALTDPSNRETGISVFLVEPGTPGFSYGAKHEKMGSNAYPTGELIFKNCRVPRENLFGEVGWGYWYGMNLMHQYRPVLAAEAVGLAQAALEASIDYSKLRVQFGHPIGTYQAMQMLLADMAMDVAAARQLVYYAAWLPDNGLPCKKEGLIAKMFACEMVNRVVYKATEIFAGAGYMKGCPVERFYRDARIFTTAEGTSQILRFGLARDLLERQESSEADWH